MAGRRHEQQGSSRVFVIAAAIAVLTIGMAVAAFLMISDIPPEAKDIEAPNAAGSSFSDAKFGG
jgi:hypothetical protein